MSEVLVLSSSHIYPWPTKKFAQPQPMPASISDKTSDEPQFCNFVAAYPGSSKSRYSGSGCSPMATGKNERGMLHCRPKPCTWPAVNTGAMPKTTHGEKCPLRPPDALTSAQCHLLIHHQVIHSHEIVGDEKP